MTRARSLTLATLILCLLTGLLLTAAPAWAGVEPYGTDDYGGFWNILPPGENGLDNTAQLLAFETTGTYPAHSHDQYDMYQNLEFAGPISESQIPDYFVNATFGVPPGEVASTQTPEPGVTIIRDKNYGIPHIYGDTRPELMYGIGYATGEDRLFVVDALRHLGEGDLAQFAGGSNATQDAFTWAVAPYTTQDYQNELNALAASGPQGAQGVQDIDNYVDGLNAYIEAARQNPLLMPGEYALLGHGGPALFTPTDIVAITVAVGALFGDGGGNTLQWTTLLQSFEQRFGKTQGYQDWLDFHELDDPEDPTSVHGVNFPYDTVPAKVNAASVAMPDPGSVVYPAVQVKTSAADPNRTQSGLSTLSARTREADGAAGGLFNFGEGHSNALVVSAKDSATGHPLAVFGPQVGYFSPELFMEEDIHGPGIDADGVGFAGINFYVLLGHGDDYAWSATSGYADLTDTFAVPLCNPSGGPVAADSTYYEYRGHCLAMQELQRTESWTPNLADSTPAGSQVLTQYRTELGLLEARATIKGKPVAYVLDRSTYDHELNSLIGFQDFNNPSFMTGPRQFEQAANKVGMTFNWLYVDSKHTAFFNSGLYPDKAKGVNPLFPTWDTDTWQGFNPANNTSEDLSFARHPQVIDQPWITSWNNAQAPEFSEADDDGVRSSIWRSVLLDDGIKSELAATQDKLTLAELVNVMENAATQDIRGALVIPYALKVIGNSSNPAVAQAVSELKAWIAAGAHRMPLVPGGPYVYSDAVKIMDAWWPLLVQAIYQPVLGSSLLAQLEAVDPPDNIPNGGSAAPGIPSAPHIGSAWDVGFYGQVQKDLRQVLRLPVKGPYHRIYCGNGSLSACRAALESTLVQAAGESFDQVYPGDAYCKAGEQTCWDEIRFEPLGAITQPLMTWQNRPTFQQVVSVQGHVPFPAEPNCIYAEYPTATITAAGVSGAAVRVAGQAVPRDCGVAPAKLVSVQVAIQRRVGARCEYATRGGELSPPRSCATPLYLTAHGTAQWRLWLTHALPAGRYGVLARAIDASDNVSVARERPLTVKLKSKHA